MKVIIAGSREFNDYNELCMVCDYYLSKQTEIEIVSGTAKGADRFGERYAKERGYELKLFPADWNRFGSSAGYKRNVEMAEYSDALIAFWNKESKGTKHMIDIAKSKGLKVRVIYFN